MEDVFTAFEMFFQQSGLFALIISLHATQILNSIESSRHMAMKQYP
jgi:hypothetical protein